MKGLSTIIQVSGKNHIKLNQVEFSENRFKGEYLLSVAYGSSVQRYGISQLNSTSAWSS